MSQQWILDELNKAGRTQADLARFMGVSVFVVNKMIRSPRRRFLAREDRKIREFLALPKGSSFPAADRPNLPAADKSNRIERMEARIERIERLLDLREGIEA